MANPVRYVELLRRQNVLHCIWHEELQQRITKLEKGIGATASMLEGYAGNEVASVSKLHRYAQQLREVLNA